MPVKSATQLQIPTSIEAATFRTLESILKNDPVLGPLMRHFAAMRDDEADFIPPTWAICPYLRISIGPVASDWATEGQHEGGFALNCDMAVQGTDIVNLFNFWGVIRRAIFPWDNTASALIAQKIRGPHPELEGVTKARIRQMIGYQPLDADEVGHRMYAGRGIIELPMLIRT
jgi:hypothetical protein